MPIQIDRMDTSIEILAPDPAHPGGERRTTASERGTQTALRDAIGAVMADELDRFLRNRGM